MAAQITKTYGLCVMLLMLGVLLSGFDSPTALAVPKDTIPGNYFAYDYALDNLPLDPKNISGLGQAEIVDYKGKHEVYTWNEDDEHPGHCLRFKPNGIGDYITFRIHIAQTLEKSDYLYKLESSCANFDNEGIYQFEVDGKVFGPPHDGRKRTKWIHGSWTVRPGDYKITYRYIGKSKTPTRRKSTGNVLNLVWIEFG